MVVCKTATAHGSRVSGRRSNRRHGTNPQGQTGSDDHTLRVGGGDHPAITTD